MSRQDRGELCAALLAPLTACMAWTLVGAAAWQMFWTANGVRPHRGAIVISGRFGGKKSRTDRDLVDVLLEDREAWRPAFSPALIWPTGLVRRILRLGARPGLCPWVPRRNLAFWA